MANEGNDGPAGSYVAGGWTAVAGSRAWLLIDADPGGPKVAELWQKLRRNRPGIGAIDLAKGQDRAPIAFGLVRQTDRGVVAAVGGRVVLEVVTAETVQRLDCPPFATFVEYHFTQAPASVEILAADLDRTDIPLPLSGGVVRADRVILNWGVASADVAQTAPDLRDGDIATSLGTDHSGETLPPESWPENALDDVPAREPKTVFGSADDQEHKASDSPDAADVTSSQQEPTYDFLFGSTVGHEAAAAAAQQRHDDATAVAPAVRSAGEAPSSPPSLSPSPAVDPPTAPPDLIDEVPWTRSPSQTETTPPGPTPPSPSPEESTDLTVNRAALLRQMASQGTLAQSGPTVHAVRCPAQHPNPAHADLCRVCGVSIEDQFPITVPRPVLGTLRLSTGDPIVLDRGVILGRSPVAGRVRAGDRPNLVKLPSPDQDISRSHVEVTLDGWHVLVTDLNSTNGTMIARPGQAPVRLRPDEPTVIEPGTVVSISDDISFVFDAI